MNTNRYAAAKDKLNKAGLSPSIQRIAILQYLLDHSTHPTVDEIYSALIDEIPTLSRTTVHNTVKLFSDMGLALSLTIEEKQMRYDVDVHPHAHFRCQVCGRIEDVEMRCLPAFMDQSMKVVDVQVLIKGVCSKCK